jgi:dihydrofolate reductase
MIVSLIAALSRNRVIGNDGGLPWHLPEDLRYFARTTRGKPVIMGRRTYESVGRPLPGRLNIVISRRPDLQIEGARVVGDPEAALEAAAPAEEVMICGGAAIYAAFLPRADRLYLTLVDTEIEGDTFFPEIDDGEWVTLSREQHGADAAHAHPLTFLVLERRRASGPNG